MIFLIFLHLARSYDYNGLNIEWKPTACKTVNCTDGYLSNDFNIHGMWPNNWNGTYPSNCGNSTLNITQSTESVLLTCWISYNGNNTSFWEHEWLKHGTCVFPSMLCDDYFSTTAGIYFGLNVLHVLGSYGIVPSNTITYQVSQILSAFYYPPKITCSLINGTYYLSTLMFCFDSNFNWIICQGKPGSCGNGLLLPLA